MKTAYNWLKGVNRRFTPHLTKSHLLAISALALAGAAFVLLGLAREANANTCPASTTNTWTGAGGDDSWANGANWTSLSAPSGADSVCLTDDAPGPAVVTLPSTSLA